MQYTLRLISINIHCTNGAVLSRSTLLQGQAKADSIRAMKAPGFWTSALDGGEWSASRPGHALDPEKGPPGTHCTGGWVGPRAGLDTEARGKFLSPLPGIEPRSPGHPVRSQTLH
jgi:hypothetical protein